MDVREINDISDSFLEAWKEFFGAKMSLIPLDVEASQPDSVYGESNELVYDLSKSVEFHGSLREHESLDKEVVGGYDEQSDLTLVLISKELSDKSYVLRITDLVKFVDSDNQVTHYRITDISRRVQLQSFRIFTRLKLVKMNTRFKLKGDDAL